MSARSLGENEARAQSLSAPDAATALPQSRASSGGAAETDRTRLIGQVISERYRVETLLGEGGMGCVYRGVHVHMKKTVALKVLHRELTYVPEMVARFEREAVAAARIAHENVAAATDFGRLEDGSFFLALEFIEGESLRRLIRSEGALPVRRVVGIIHQIAEALDAAHQQGVVHRDLKPENVMLVNRGPGQDVIKVLDFGIAKVTMADTADSNQLTQHGAIFGTPEYMSPEQAAGKPVDHRSDLYTLGILMYELLTGATPFSDDAIVVVLTRQMTEPPPALPNSTDPRLAELTMWLLEKDPVMRPQSAREFIDKLDALKLSIPPRAAALRATGRKTIGEARRGLSRLAKLSGTLWQSATRRAPRLKVLEHPLRFGRFRAPVGAVMFVAVCLSTLALGALLSDSSPGASQKASVTLEDATKADGPQVTVAFPSAGSRDRLNTILQIPVYKRKLKDWLELGREHARLGEWSESTAAYRNAVQLDKKTGQDPRVLQAFRTAAEQRESYEAALNVAVNLLGEPGMDLVYDLWMKTKGDKRKRLISELAYKKLEILRLRRASKPLRVRLALEFTKPSNCLGFKQTVEAATRFADSRCIEKLEALTKKQGCGADKKQDCYACLRDNEDLVVALATARERRAPEFDGVKYVPGD